MSEIIIGNKEELKPEVKTGKVVNCQLLNVRKRPKRDAEILRVIAKDDEVEILNNVGEFLNFLMGLTDSAWLSTLDKER